ncbi:beta-lactamase family protein [Chitinophaga sedimenti]|nr:serine hydrolase domain-containing protein [Chitinophaga sedimenti]MCK7555942.1 beta-lactamase family protein [Chitinophaga sedimenti]
MSGQDLPAFAAANIFKPLKMNHTQVSRTHKVAGKAQGYVSSGNGFVVANTKNSVVGQGNVYSMVTDFRPWFREMDKQQVLGAAVWKKMLTPGVLNNGEMTNYGGGLHITEDVITHGGDVAGYHSGMYHFPAKGLDIVVLSNNDHVSGRMVFRAIYGLLYPKQPIADAAVAAPVVAIDTLHYTGIYAAASDSLLNIELSVEDGNLMAEQLWNSEKYRIVAVSDSIFEIDGAPEVKFAFTSAATEKAAAFDILQDGQRIAFKRTAKVAALDSRLAASYAGTYYNSEIDARYQVLVGEGKLIVVIGKERFVMSRFKDGVFGLDNGLVLEFNKGGFKLVHSRVWELQFEKI